MRTTRREFFGHISSAAMLAPAQPEAKVGSIKIVLYSMTYAGLWCRGRTLTLEEVVDRARQFGYGGVEVGEKRPHGNPLDMPKSRCQQLRKYAADKGI